MLGGHLLCFHYYGHGFPAVNVYGHGVTGMTLPLLLMASMQTSSVPMAIRVALPGAGLHVVPHVPVLRRPHASVMS